MTSNHELRKLEEGSDLIKLFNAVDKSGNFKVDPATHMDPVHAVLSLERLMSYCIQDCKVTAAVHLKMEHLPEGESAVLQATTEMNDRGVAFDLDLAAVLDNVNERVTANAGHTLSELTGGAVSTPRQHAKFKEFLNEALREHGLTASGVAKDVLDDLLSRVPEDSRAHVLIETWRAASGDALTKASAALRRHVAGRVRGEYISADAHSNRWVSRGCQLQNLIRSSLKEWQQYVAIDLLRAGQGVLCPPLLDCSEFDAAKAVLRPMFVPGPGKALAISDFARIEFQVLMWSSGALPKLKLVSDPYRLLACVLNPSKYQPNAEIRSVISKVMNGSSLDDDAIALLEAALKSVTKLDRQIAKPFVLGAGFGGGANRLMSEFKKQGIEVSFDTAQEGINAYNKIWPEVPRYRQNLITGVGSCIAGNGPVKVGETVTFRMEDGDLLAQLYGGAVLRYHRANVSVCRNRQNKTEYVPTYKKVLAGGGRVRVNLIEPELIAHITSATARQLMAHAFVNASQPDSGVVPVMCTHDELVCEVEPGTSDLLHQIMINAPGWVPDGVVGAETHESDRYNK